MKVLLIKPRNINIKNPDLTKKHKNLKFFTFIYLSMYLSIYLSIFVTQSN